MMKYSEHSMVLLNRHGLSTSSVHTSRSQDHGLWASTKSSEFNLNAEASFFFSISPMLVKQKLPKNDLTKAVKTVVFRELLNS